MMVIGHEETNAPDIITKTMYCGEKAKNELSIRISGQKKGTERRKGKDERTMQN